MTIHCHTLSMYAALMLALDELMKTGAVLDVRGCLWDHTIVILVRESEGGS